MRKLGWLVAAFGVLAWGATPSRAADVPKNLLPDDTEAVFHINIKAALDSVVVKTFAMDAMKKALDGQPAVGQILQQLGLDPWKDLDSLTVAVCKVNVNVANANPVPNASAEAVLFIDGRFDLEKMTGLVKQINGVVISEHNKITIYEVKEAPEPVYAAFLGKERIIAVNKRERLVAALDQNAGKKQPNLNKPLAGMLDKVNQKQSMWMAMTLPETVKALLAAAPQAADVVKNIEGVTFGVTLRDDILTEILVHTTDKNSAADIRRGLEQGKAAITVLALNDKDYGILIADVLNEVKISNDGNVAKIKVDLTAELVEKFVKQIREIRMKNQ
jgi:hypothetical protein